jgi:predicted AAA+ superfamily ATPase
MVFIGFLFNFVMIIIFNMQRKSLSKVIDHLERKEFTILIGPRQVGKTTLLKQVNEYNKKKNQISTLITFENPEILTQINIHPENIFRFVPKPTDTNTVFLLIDEIQYAENPSNFLKYLYDTYAPNLKIVATGSSAFYIDQKFTDSLAGRKIVFQIYSLDFEEYLLFKGREDLITELKLIQKQEQYLSANYKDLDFQLLEYMQFGSYPAVVLETNPEYKLSLLKELRNSFLKKDILESDIEHEDKFYMLTTILASQIGNTINQHELASTLKLNEKTLNRYLFILQKCFHINLVKPFFQNIRKELTKMPKIYFNDLGLRNVMLNQFDMTVSRLDKGALFENLIHNILRDKNIESVKYWRTADGNEVDFVIETSFNQGYAIEAKWNAENYKASTYKKFTENYPNLPLKLMSMEFSNPQNCILKI